MLRHIMHGVKVYKIHLRPGIDSAAIILAHPEPLLDGFAQIPRQIPGRMGAQLPVSSPRGYATPILLFTYLTYLEL